MLSEVMKNFVLDTNVLLHDPTAVFRFEENTVNIPIFVIEEIDRFADALDGAAKRGVPA